ncbi:MAG TPA: di-heme oxidoredictase family protein [Isosphaeraceae bacterium]|jgi:CxxC motif-containing protein (DUF1111 family)|nr:di-heme oxidoredictase family protein [Isosphaeraceae bacterium]
MQGNVLERARRRCGVGLGILSGLAIVWYLVPGLPVLWAPRASAHERAAGQALFVHEWQPHDPLAHGDGLGPVFNARACASCHFQGGVGGGGGNDHNVQAFEAHPTKDRPDVQGGLIHKYAVADQYVENQKSIRDFFPVVPNGVRIEGGCQILIRDFDPLHAESINSTALFGAGWIDRISGKNLLQRSREASLRRIGQELTGNFGGILPGRARVLADGRVGKFGWKAQFATLEEFVAAACANEIGLGNPHMPQAKPWVRWQYPETKPDLDGEQFRSLVAFVDTLPRPDEVVPSDAKSRDHATRGKTLFHKVGCVACHIPDVDRVAGVYSDFLLHRLEDRRNGSYGVRETTAVPLPEDYPLADEWKTPALWGVADSAPYFHDGKSPTLETAILRHHGDAESVLDAYRNLFPDEQAAIVAFLKTLKAPVDAEPVSTGDRKDLALNR